MSSIEEQSLPVTAHHALYPAIDPGTALKESASGKVVFLTGASQGIGQATAVAFARAGAAAVYLTARSAQTLEETKAKVLAANPETRCEFSLCDVTNEEQVKAAIEDCVKKFGAIDAAEPMPGIWRSGQRSASPTRKIGGRRGKSMSGERTT